jgi:hypothetical protein
MRRRVQKLRFSFSFIAVGFAQFHIHMKGSFSFDSPEAESSFNSVFCAAMTFNTCTL